MIFWAASCRYKDLSNFACYRNWWAEEVPISKSQFKFLDLKNDSCLAVCFLIERKEEQRRKKENLRFISEKELNKSQTNHIIIQMEEEQPLRSPTITRCHTIEGERRRSRDEKKWRRESRVPQRKKRTIYFNLSGIQWTIRLKRRIHNNYGNYHALSSQPSIITGCGKGKFWWH